MNVITELVSSINRKDEMPNKILAKNIAETNNANAVKVLIGLLQDENKDVWYNSIKVLYETGALNPGMISGYCTEFIALSKSKDNRIQWGAMTALHVIVKEKPALIYRSIPALLLVAKNGSVITRDNFVGILIHLYSLKHYAENILPLLVEQLAICPSNQLPMYAESFLKVIRGDHKGKLLKVLTSRVGDFEKEPKRKRVEKVIKKLQLR